MKNKQFLVNLKTPLGNRPGEIEVNTDGSKIWGTLKILKHSSSFKGKIVKSGHCLITGTFKTLLRTVKFRATGSITESNIDLVLLGDRNVYSLKSLEGTQKAVVL